MVTILIEWVYSFKEDSKTNRLAEIPLKLQFHLTLSGRLSSHRAAKRGPKSAKRSVRMKNQDAASPAVLVRVVGTSPSFVQEVLSMSTSWSPLIPPSLNREPLPKDLGEYGRGITLTGLTMGIGSRADPDGDPS